MSVIVLSVGTSLLTNNLNLRGAEALKDAFEKNQVKVDSIRIEMTDGHPEAQPENIEGLCDFTIQFVTEYFENEAIQNNISKRARGEDHLPAEISSLYLYYYDKDGGLRAEFKGRLKGGSDTQFVEKDRVILLTTDTADAVYCAHVLKEMINNVSMFSEKCNVTDIEKIRNLDVYDARKYVAQAHGEDLSSIHETGLGQLYAYFVSNFGNAKNSESEDRIMIRTGGYKEFSADLKMLAMQFGFHSLYLFERSVQMIVVSQLSWPRDFSQVALCSRRRG